MGQDRCAGVIEAIHVARSVYSSPISHTKCPQHFWHLSIPSTHWNLQQYEMIIKQQFEQLSAVLPQNGKQLKTQQAWKFYHYTVILQNLAQRYLFRRRLARLRAGTISLQALWCGYVLCKRVRLISLASIQHQARFRGRRALICIVSWASINESFVSKRFTDYSIS
ncbi:hypothetical protein ABG067_004834 [Albugo candida]